MKILSSFTHPQFVANLYEFLSSAEHKWSYFEYYNAYKPWVRVCFMWGYYELGRAAQLLRLIPRDLFLADGSIFLSLCQSLSLWCWCVYEHECFWRFKCSLAFWGSVPSVTFGQSHLLFTC